MTSKYKIASKGDLIECPYNKTHMIRAERFPYHLMKCRKGYIGNEYAVCPFNARHELPKPELRYHIATCSDKAILDEDIKYAKTGKSSDLQRNTFKGNTTVPSYSETTIVPVSGENWDNEPPVIVRLGANVDAFMRKSWAQTHPLDGSSSVAKPLKPVSDDMRLPDPVPQPKAADSQALTTSLPLKMKPSVYAYSLSMAGIGRGQPMEGKRKEGPGVIKQGSVVKEGPETDQKEEKVTKDKPPVYKEQEEQPGETAPVCPGSPTPSEQSLSSIQSSIVGYKRMTEDKKMHASIMQSLALGRGIGRGLPLSALSATTVEDSEPKVGLMALAE